MIPPGPLARQRQWPGLQSPGFGRGFFWRFAPPDFVSYHTANMPVCRPVFGFPDTLPAQGRATRACIAHGHAVARVPPAGFSSWDRSRRGARRSSPRLPPRAGGIAGSRGLVVPWWGESPRGGQGPLLGLFARPDAALVAPGALTRWGTRRARLGRAFAAKNPRRDLNSRKMRVGVRGEPRADPCQAVPADAACRARAAYETVSAYAVGARLGGCWRHRGQPAGVRA